MSTFKFRKSIKCDLAHFKPAQYNSSSSNIASIQEGNKVTIRDTNSYDIKATIVCPSDIDYFLFSPDCKLIAILTKDPNSVQIYMVDKVILSKDNLTIPICSLSGGIIEIEKILWSPNSKFILMCSVFSIIIFIYSIESKKIIKIPPPKNAFGAFCFSPNGNNLAILTRENRKDLVAIYDGTSFKVKKTITLNTLDAKTLVWSPNGLRLLVIDEISHNLLEIINLETGSLYDFSEYDGYLGITDAVFDLNPTIVSVGSFDNLVRIFSFDGWKALAELSHETLISEKSIIVYEERDGRMKLIKPPVTLEKGDGNGITNIKVSPTNKFIATTSAEIPKSIFIWNLDNFMISTILIFKTDVHQINWSPQEDVLSALTESNILYLWTPNETCTVSDESIESIDYLIWRQDGEELILFDPSAGNFDILSK